MELFSEDELKTRDIPLCSYTKAFIGSVREASVFTLLRDGLAWKQNQVRLFGRMIPEPRLSAWYGDPNAAYVYSGVMHSPLEWTPLLLELKKYVEDSCGRRFNSVLCNYYRGGQDSMGWHSDNEPELGPEPMIASLNFGASRWFAIRENYARSPIHKILLEPGSLLVMKPGFQEKFKHALPRQSNCNTGRINLTFRHVSK